jgi:hypothetical protein
MADGFDDAVLGQALPALSMNSAFSRAGNAPWISYSPYWNIDRNNGLVCAFERAKRALCKYRAVSAVIQFTSAVGLSRPEVPLLD